MDHSHRPSSTMAATAATMKIAASRTELRSGAQTVGADAGRISGRRRHIAEAASTRPHHHVR